MGKLFSDKTEQILNEMLENTDVVIEQIAKQIPADFPKHISEPIFEGLFK